MLLKFVQRKFYYGYEKFKKFEFAVSSFYGDIDEMENEKLKLLKTMLRSNALIWFYWFTPTTKRHRLASTTLFLFIQVLTRGIWGPGYG
jgi:hypothetical protein